MTQQNQSIWKQNQELDKGKEQGTVKAGEIVGTVNTGDKPWWPHLPPQDLAFVTFMMLWSFLDLEATWYDFNTSLPMAATKWEKRLGTLYCIQSI